MGTRFRILAILAAGALLGLTAPATSDEGMWLYNDPPMKLLKEKYNFTPTKEWLEHLQKSSVRFNSGGSGSFVSADGLVMTNHHVGADTLQKMSTKERDYIKTGFHAKSREEEVKAVGDLELNVLLEITDVSAKVNAAVKPDATPAEAQKARRAIMNTLEEEALKDKDKTKYASEMVTLYQGGAYHLYFYRKYTDIRLVFAPEKDIAFFGGDPDNFEYPRFDLDVCFFRVYEDGKPIKPEHYLKWSEAGAKDGELTFVSGHPGRTDRLNTMAHLEFMRDKTYPLTLNVLRRREVMLGSWSGRDKENLRRCQDDLFSIQNSRKARLGGLAGLQDPKLMGAKAREQSDIVKALSVIPGEKPLREYREAVEQVGKSIKVWSDIYDQHYTLERGIAFYSESFGIARTLVRLAEERGKPNPERLREYSEANMDSLKQQLFSEAPIYEDLETLKLADGLSLLVEMLGPGNELVQKVLAGKSPSQRAYDLIHQTKVRDVAFRRKLEEGGRKALDMCDDPMIQLAKLIDDPARKVRKVYEDQVQEPQRQAYAKIAQAQFVANKGKEAYPDATFTLRLAFGPVKGYIDDGKQVAPWTTIGGAYKHAEAHDHRDPFKLPESWMKRKDKLNLDTPFNFVSTADIIGGNSGSPVVNAKGEVVGLIFDGNIQSLVLDFAYSDEVARAVSVHSAGIVEAMRKVYDAGALADELTGKK